MRDVVFGIGLALLAAVAGVYGYELGVNSVVDDCVNYGKYHLRDSTQEFTCSALFEPEKLYPSVEETNAKFYSKENKDKHRKDRK